MKFRCLLITVRRLDGMEQRLSNFDQGNRNLNEMVMKLQKDMRVTKKIIAINRIRVREFQRLNQYMYKVGPI